MSTTRLALAWTLILLAAKSQGEDRKTLLSVHVLYRHGERTPVDPYPNDPYKVGVKYDSIKIIAAKGQALQYEIWIIMWGFYRTCGVGQKKKKTQAD